MRDAAAEGEYEVSFSSCVLQLTCRPTGIALVFPDTSPRGAGIEGEDKDWDFGTGAGFYVNATSDTYSKHYNMCVVSLPLSRVRADPTLPLSG